MALEEAKPASAHKGGSDTDVPKKGWRFSRSKKLEEDLAHVNREIYSRNLELAQTNKTLALLQAIDSLVLNADDALEPLATKLATEVVKVGYPFVTILGYSPQSPDVLQAFGWAAADGIKKPAPDFIHKASFKSPQRWFKANEVLTFFDLQSVTDAQLAHYANTSEAEAGEVRANLGVKAGCCIKLSARQQLVGVMVIGLSEYSSGGPNDFERSLFLRLSEAVGIALDHKILLEENQRVLAQLEKSNAKLRTLDKTKDDFISMASHQLRTPLTSVKGYVSMILDGDAGKISPLQRKLLNQSFLSSQRMAYLISDLLNVSRLRTGKFIIDPVPCDLSKVIEEEVSQLIETVKARGLEMTYHKPPKFPTLMLDEIKLRQVIMNFVDNAMYYTPSGGHVDIYLADKPESIEFTVVDDGIGVPKNEQHHLFTKFYRAHNAKHARPDGTGLGIFMAKKVIIAQGGALIFKSAENKGSTFGFTFPKNKLQKPIAPPPEANPPETKT